MPEFEEPEAINSSKENYTPSTDATNKPRTRRRSGGFKTEYTAPKLGIGEVDPVEALKREKLSGSAKPQPESKREKSAPRTDRPERRPERRREAPRREAPSTRVSNADPSAETLAAIQRVEARLNERRAARGDTRRSEKPGSRPDRAEKTPTGERRSPTRKPQSSGILNSILSFFGLGAKPTASKKSDQSKPSGSRSQSNRPRSKGGSDSRGQGPNRRSSNKGRRSGGNGPRRNDRRNRETQS